MVPESGEDSEDEWNYIKVQKESSETAQLASLDSVQPHEDASFNHEHTETSAHAQVEQTPDAPNSIERIESPVSVTESHAVAQALAESHEELLEQHDHQTEEDHQDTLEPELLKLEAEASAAATEDVAAAFSVAASTTTPSADDDDMDSQLNPDAKEFVPVSPQRSPATSPFGNGGVSNTFHRNDLLKEDDCVLAQSPRKGGSSMKNINIPDETAFDMEISHRPQEVLEDLNVSLIENEAIVGSVPNAAQNGSDRPGSSSSQYSYQEMNLKEAMHGDEKQEYAPEDAIVSPVAGAAPSDDLSTATDPLSEVTNESNVNHVNDKFLRESDPMSMSFYNDGSSDTGNPFADGQNNVDLNAVQILPVDDDEAVEPPSVEIPYHFEGQEGQHFVIQDTEFGMNGGVEARFGDSPVDVRDEISKPEEDQFSPDVEVKPTHSLEFQQEPTHFESDQPESDLPAVETSSIVQLVQEMASEVTSVLNEPSPGKPVQFEADHFDEPHFHNTNQFKEFDENASQVTATPTDGNPLDRVTPFEELAEAEQNYSHESAPEHLVEAVEEIIVKTVAKRAADAPAEVTDEPNEPSECEQELVDNTLAKMVGGELVSHEGENPEKVVAVEGVEHVDDAAKLVVGQAAERLEVTGTATPTVEKKKSTVATKKPEIKPTVKTTTSTTAKKPVASSTLASSRSTTTTKPATATTRPTSGASPSSRPRSVPSATSTAATTKTTATTTTVTAKPSATLTSAKKPVPNGDIKSSSNILAKKTSSVTAAKTVSSTSAAPKPAVKPTPRAPISSRPAVSSVAKTTSMTSATKSASAVTTATKTSSATTK